MTGEAAHAPFVHLRLHTAYSLLEGALRMKALPALCHDHKMPALAITDSGNLFGALEFSETLSREGVQPIVGCTLSVGLERGEEAERRAAPGEKIPTLCLLAQNERGYANLMKLTSRAYLETEPPAMPHIGLDALEDLSDGLILLTGGPAGPVNRLIVENRQQMAEELLLRLAAAFKDRLYVELQRHGVPEEEQAEGPLVDWAYEHGLPLVATNEPFFASADDYEAHDALICIKEGSYITEEDRLRLTPEHYFKSPAEMTALFDDLPEATANTLEIARRCAFRPRTRAPILPRFTTEADRNEADELRAQAVAGLKQRLEIHGAVAPLEEYEQRLDFELDIITRMGFPGYFLIVADFIKWAKAHDIPVGPGRGSGAGSLVAWALTITDLDPLRFGLLFERFLNPERVSMPDFDIDFCQDRRDEVIRYVQERYGRDQVAQIITFGKLQARAVLRDVGRVLQMPYGQVDGLCKLVPNNPANPVTLEEAIDGEPRLQEAARKEEVVAHLLDIGKSLEGLYRHASTHAAGVVIGDRPLDELVPLYRDPRSDMPVTQFNMKWVEPAGLVKFDFLGLKTLTVLERAKKLLALRGIDIDLDNLPLDDAPTYEMLGRGEAAGVFQLESSGMRDALKRLKPDRIEDIIAIVALYRPGPMANIPTYIDCKFGRQEPDYLHPLLEPVLKETYGVIIYQEQVMEIAKVLAGYSLGEADLLRRAMGKKIQAEMDKQRARFISGAVERGVPEGQASQIFDLVDRFAGYGFNKSHAAAYAIVAYQTAYLKANHPVEFLAASMSLDIANTDKLNHFKQEAQRLGIEVSAPDVNASEADFTVIDGRIQYALAAVKNVGRQAMEALVAARKEGGRFRDLFDFAARLDPRQINRRALENLAKAGALDSLNPNRAQVMASAELLMGYAAQAAAERESNQTSLFGGDDGASLSTPRLPVKDDWLPMEKLQAEFEAIGFYLSGHPLDEYEKSLRRQKVEYYGDLLKGPVKEAAMLAGTLTSKQERRSKSGKPFAFLGFSDPTGQYEAVAFSDLLAGSRDLLEPGRSFVITAGVDRDGDDIRLRVQGVRPIDEVTAESAAGLRIYLEDAAAVPRLASRLSPGGKGEVELRVPVEGGRQEAEIRLPGRFEVNPKIRSAIKAVQGVLEVEEV